MVPSGYHLKEMRKRQALSWGYHMKETGTFIWPAGWYWLYQGTIWKRQRNLHDPSWWFPSFSEFMVHSHLQLSWLVEHFSALCFIWSRSSKYYIKGHRNLHEASYFEDSKPLYFIIVTWLACIAYLPLKYWYVVNMFNYHAFQIKRQRNLHKKTDCWAQSSFIFIVSTVIGGGGLSFPELLVRSQYSLECALQQHLF